MTLISLRSMTVLNLSKCLACQQRSMSREKC